MKNISLKRLIISIVFSINLLFLIIIFFVFNIFYTNRVKKNLLNENKYSVKVLKEIFYSESYNISKEAASVVRDSLVYHAFYNDIYFNLKKREKIKQDNILKFRKMNRYLFNLLASKISEKINTSGNIMTVQIFDKNLEAIARAGTIDESFFNTGKEEYIKIFTQIQNENIGLSSLGVFEKKNNKILVKGLDRVVEGGTLGVVVLTKDINMDFLRYAKRTINKEIFIITENKILYTTIHEFAGNENIILEDVKITEKDFYNGILKIDDIKINIDMFPVFDFNNNIIAYIGAGFETSILDKAYIDVIKKILTLGLIFSFVIFIVLYLVMNKNLKSFEKVAEAIEEIGEGNYRKKISTEKETKEIKKIIESIEKMAEMIYRREEKLKDWNEKLDIEIAKKTFSLQNLLDNAGQGFLTFGKNMIINKEYSRECIKILKKDIAGEKFSFIFFDEKEISFIENILKNIFESNDELKSKIYISLLDNEKLINNTYIKINYKYLKKTKQIMVLLTDVTKEKMLEEKVEKEENKFKMIIKVFSNQLEFKHLIKDYEEFVNVDIKNMNNIEINRKKSFEIYRKIHTFKGNFAQYNMYKSEEKLEEIEKSILKYLKNKFDSKEFSKKIYGYNFNEILQEDIENIIEFLGDDFFNEKNEIKINEERLIILEEKIKRNFAPKEAYKILGDIKKLRDTNIKEVFKNYNEYVKSLSKNLGKDVEFKIVGKDFFVDYKYYKEFFNTLIHLIRNAISHGIENSDERVEKGKSLKGNIILKYNIHRNNMIFSVEDDGNGIDEKYLLEKLKQYKNIEIPLNIIDIIFKEGFSTYENTDKVSGKGLGLSALKKEIDRHKGKIEITTKKDEGTKFNITIPIKDEEKILKINSKRCFEIILKTLTEFIKENIGNVLNTKLINSIEIEELKEYTTVMELKGQLDSKIIFSIDENSFDKIYQKILIDKSMMLNEIEKIDLLKEFLNTVVGNSAGEISEKLDINLSNFKFLNSIKGKNKIFIDEKYEVYGVKIVTEIGEMVIIYYN